MGAQGRRNELFLGGLPALQTCNIAFYVQNAGEAAAVHVSEASFGSQRNSLQNLKLRGVSGSIHVVNLGYYLSQLPALRFLAVRHLDVRNLMWLESSWSRTLLALCIALTWMTTRPCSWMQRRRQLCSI